MGDDAVTRLEREHRALTALAGLDCVPEVYGVRTVWEHRFLMTEYVEGPTLLDEIVARFALVRGARTADELAPYAAWVHHVTAQLGDALREIHGRGMRFGDLHPSNIILRPDGRLALVDFEYATELDDEKTPLAGAPGLQAPPGTPGAEADAYALWATWLTMLMPLTEMASHDRVKALSLESWARGRARHQDLLAVRHGTQHPARPAGRTRPASDRVSDPTACPRPVRAPACPPGRQPSVAGRRPSGSRTIRSARSRPRSTSLAFTSSDRATHSSASRRSRPWCTCRSTSRRTRISGSRSRNHTSSSSPRTGAQGPSSSSR
ncbi:serine/threonine protein kinase [Streptomyces sp. HCCB10043]|nr:serine/threonine protein kinase [Streptomyces sp. HCCB10043]